MNTIDIRDAQEISVEEIKIQFAEESEEYACYLTLEEGTIRLNDDKLCREPDVKIKDIDNLIKALQKAKEIWT